MSNARTAYWLATGALLGFGFIGIWSIGLPFLVLGLGMVVFGAIRRWYAGAWAALVGLGGLPSLILLADLLSAPWACLPGGGVAFTTPSHVDYYSCVQTPLGPLTTYHVLAAVFAVIALVGIAWGVFEALRRRSSGPLLA
jgi:hypothetical protein